MATEIDPPLVETLKKKPNRRFASVKGGVDAAQVDAFLVAIASSIEALEAESHELEVTLTPSAEVTSRSPEEDPAEGSSKAIERFSKLGEREIEKMLAEAKAEAATVVSEARSEAERITKDAQDDAARSLNEARTFLDRVEVDARRIPSEVAERRQQMTEDLQKMQERLLSIASALDLAVEGG